MFIVTEYAALSKLIKLMHEVVNAAISKGE